MPTSPPPDPTPGNNPQTTRSFVWNAVIDGLGPYVIYMALHHRHSSEMAAIGWSMLPPAVNNVWTLIRKRHLDIIGVIVLAGLLAGLGLFLLGGSPQMILARDSLITGTIALLFLVSLLFPRPLLFYMVRQISTANDPKEGAEWDADYDHSRYKYGLPLMTAVWGVVLLGEAALRVKLAFTLPTATFLAVSPVVNLAIYAAAIGWSFFYGRRMRDLEDAEAMAEAEAA